MARRNNKKDFRRDKRNEFHKDGMPAANEKRESTKKYINDPDWYKVSDELMKDTASWAWYQPIGVPMNLGLPDSECDFHSQQVPTVMAIRIHPTFGSTKDGYLAPLNVASRQDFAELRRRNTSEPPYQQSDNFIYEMAMDQVYSYHSWMRRVYGLVNYYTRQNLTIPKVLFTAMGVDYQDIMLHMPNFRAYINTYALRASAWAVPATKSLFKRHYMMYEGVFADMKSPKAQLYLFQPDGFYLYDETTYDTGAALSFMKFKSEGTTGLLKFDDVINWGEQMLNPLIGSSTIGLVSGDTLKTYGAENCFSLRQLDEGYMAPIDFNQAMLEQIHNLRTVQVFPCNGEPPAAGVLTPTYVQTQNDLVNGDYIEWKAAFVVPGRTCRVNSINDSSESSPDPALVTELTRLTAIPTNINPNTTWNTSYRGTAPYPVPMDCEVSCGSEVAVRLCVYEWNHRTNTVNLTSYGSYPVVHASQGEGDYTALLANSKFDWAPILYVGSTDETFSYCEGIYGDISNFRVTTAIDVKRINDVALMAEFGIGRAGSKDF